MNYRYLTVNKTTRQVLSKGQWTNDPDAVAFQSVVNRCKHKNEVVFIKQYEDQTLSDLNVIDYRKKLIVHNP